LQQDLYFGQLVGVRGGGKMDEYSWDISAEDAIAYICCLISPIRADILMKLFDIEEQIAWEEALEKFHAHMESWNKLTDEEKQAWWLEE
jgi:arginine utilization protein RocB